MLLFNAFNKAISPPWSPSWLLCPRGGLRSANCQERSVGPRALNGRQTQLSGHGNQTTLYPYDRDYMLRSWISYSTMFLGSSSLSFTCVSLTPPDPLTESPPSVVRFPPTLYRADPSHSLQFLAHYLTNKLSTVSRRTMNLKVVMYR